MSGWNFSNIGASSNPDNIRYISKIFEYLGISEKPAWSAAAYDKEPVWVTGAFDKSFSNPEIYGCSWSEYDRETIKGKICFTGFLDGFLVTLLNALFPETVVYEHSSTGDTISDTYEFSDWIYDPRDMTAYVKNVYVSHDVGSNGTESYKMRFGYENLNTHYSDYIEEMLHLSQEEGETELFELLKTLLQKLKQGRNIFNDDPSDIREVNVHYDVKEEGSLARKRKSRKLNDSDYIKQIMMKKLPWQKFSELYKVESDGSCIADLEPDDEYRQLLLIFLICYSGKKGRTLNISYVDTPYLNSQ